ncbi:hypothetical protein Krac_0501 [Ktedonobacter racemifer DSM 44963]|uniref:Uncharacterized protein n=1 Tax=Ktedonobacter racemifer DSM 44963 TaxID=485913 RepID=D6U7V8_KTERA|nr:hypothetical protein Krac_0501 [Ktedonobacter racemifer DSM 44963]
MAPKASLFPTACSHNNELHPLLLGKQGAYERHPRDIFFFSHPSRGAGSIPGLDACLVYISTQPSGCYPAFYGKNVEALPQLYFIERLLVKSFMVRTKMCTGLRGIIRQLSFHSNEDEKFGVNPSDQTKG